MNIYNTIKKDVEKAKKALNGKKVYENFGQKYVHKLKDKYYKYEYGDNEERIAYSLIKDFECWCMDYNGE